MLTINDKTSVIDVKAKTSRGEEIDIETVKKLRDVFIEKQIKYQRHQAQARDYFILISGLF
ncbi:hypothetical protein [Clostridium sp. N3C]|uniref:hypothetical protein n=1 Tax=Clostridium sp. N3C TaxID=1776758 RepID=UPI000943F5B8|nr:hypothetical protein [Clostridium sp. N3C]